MAECREFDLIGCYAIIQGETYVLGALLYPDEDISDGTPYGTIRDNYEDSTGTELATFSFYPLTYDALTQKTTITPYLTKETTRALPFTKFQNEEGDTPTLRNSLVYEIGITKSTGENIVLISSSFVQVIPHT